MLINGKIVESKIRECPYCEAMILKEAQKCSHCGEWVVAISKGQTISWGRTWKWVGATAALIVVLKVLGGDFELSESTTQTRTEGSTASGSKVPKSPSEDGAEAEAAKASDLVVIADAVNVRDVPSTGFNVIAQLKRHDSVYQIQKENDWIEVTLADDLGTVGWVHGALYQRP